MDRLDSLFAMQQTLMDYYDVIEKKNGAIVPDEWDRGMISRRDVQTRIRELIHRAEGEMEEALQELKNKPWKAVEQATNGNALYEEFIDASFFFLEALIMAGITPELFHSISQRKYNTCLTRIKEGIDG